MSGLKLKRFFSGLNIQFVVYFLLFAYLPLLTFSILGYNLNKRLIKQVHENNLKITAQNSKDLLLNYFADKAAWVERLYAEGELKPHRDCLAQFQNIVLINGNSISLIKGINEQVLAEIEAQGLTSQLFLDHAQQELFFRITPAEGVSIWASVPLADIRRLLRSEDPHSNFYLRSQSGETDISVKGDQAVTDPAKDSFILSFFRDDVVLEYTIPFLPNWNIVSDRSAKGIYGDLENFLKEIFMGNLVIGILLFALAIFLAGRITKPIQQLVYEANKFSEGDLSTPVSVSGNREINILASEFEVMRQKLLESYSNLEDKIAERTEALREAQFQISHQEKMASLGLLSAGVAHEIGNPLTGISSMAQIIKRKRKDPAIDEYINTIMSNIERISRIVKELVDFARPANYEAALVNPNQVIKSAVSIVSYDKRAKNSAIKMDLDDNLPDLFLVEDQLLQVFLNILINAVDACESVSAEIFINSFLDDGKVCVTFRDNGSGIPEENLTKIFEPFFTTKKVGKGTGLGLSVSYGIVKNLGGTIKAESKINEGATFTLEIPVALTEHNSET